MPRSTPRRVHFQSVAVPANPHPQPTPARRSPRRRSIQPQYNVDMIFSPKRYFSRAKTRQEAHSIVQSPKFPPKKKLEVPEPADAQVLPPQSPVKDLSTRNCSCDKPNTEKPYTFTKCGHAACQSCLDSRGTCCGKMQNVQLNYQAGESRCPVCLEDAVANWCILICGHRTCCACFDSLAKGAVLRKCPTCRKVFQVGYITSPDA